jgi:tRNA A37 methylthiotransferase MiaB
MLRLPTAVRRWQVVDMKTSLTGCLVDKKSADALRRSITEAETSTAAISKYVEAVSSLQKKTSLLRIIIETVETQITIELRAVLASTTHMRYKVREGFPVESCLVGVLIR